MADAAAATAAPMRLSRALTAAVAAGQLPEGEEVQFPVPATRDGENKALLARALGVLHELGAGIPVPLPRAGDGFRSLLAVQAGLPPGSDRSLWLAALLPWWKAADRIDDALKAVPPFPAIAEGSGLLPVLRPAASPQRP